MISKRNFITIVIMMAVLFFMFQFSQVMKEVGNQYDTNAYAGDAVENRLDQWDAYSGSAYSDGKKYAVFIGDPSSAIGNTVSQWCLFTKRRLMVRPSMEDCPENMEQNAEIILIEESRVHDEEVIRELTGMAERGMNLVFCNLPGPSIIEESGEWRNILGIREVRAKAKIIDGVNLFSGFLLGGQEIYVPEDEKEKEERQDLNLTVPWYLTGTGCKTYAVGMVPDPGVKNEQYPAIIWRNGIGDGKVFAVNGEYMSDLAGIGILNAMEAEMNPYAIYPVVNAQSLSVSNFPGCSAENGETMQRLYSRDQLAVYRDILWPSLCAMIEKSGLRMTCYLVPQSDYMDDNMPEREQLVFYLKQLKEKGAEAGLSFDYVKASNLQEKMSQDEIFFYSLYSSYRYGAIYISPSYGGSTTGLQSFATRNHILTVTAGYKKEYPVVTYLTRDLTRQSITSEGVRHTYMDDIRMKSLQTALGYSNIVLNMNHVTWPETDADRWEVVSDKFSSNINTYWRKFSMFSQTTASESDRRIRAFLGMDYTHERTGDEIRVRMKKQSDEVWMILRTHGEKILSIEGGKYEEIEEDAYLICAKENEISIRCEKTDKPYYTLP